MSKIVAAHPGPAFSVNDVHVGWVDALRKCGNKVAEYNLSERLTFYDAATIEVENKETGEHFTRKALNHEQAYELAVNGLYATLYKLLPDILFVTSAFFYPEEMLDCVRSRGTKVVVMHTESPYEDERQIKMAQHADINLINDPINLHSFREICPQTYYMPQSYRPGFHEPGPSVPEYECDFAFVGTAFHSRVAFFEKMDFSGLDVILAGNWQLIDEKSPLFQHVANDPEECLDNSQTVEVYRSAKMGMNIYRKEAEVNSDISNIKGWACGPREIEMAATGMFFMREPRGEGDELFPMLPTFTDPQEASEIMHYYLKNDDLRKESSEMARRAIADRTFDNRAIELMQLLES